MFADLLGFAALTERFPVDIGRLVARSRPLSLAFGDDLFGPKNPLTTAFSVFHHALEWGTTLARMSYPLTAITFSDSVFVATARLHEAVAFAVRLVRSTLSQGVPVRVGVGHGSFAAIRFRSDISLDGGDHATQFLGSGVVRAYEAEKCGIRGMRILLHPSTEPLLADQNHNPPDPKTATSSVRFLRCPQLECANRAGVRHEVDYWDLAVTEERKAWHSLQDMWAGAPENARVHYEATAHAVNRMRIERGQPSVEDLRRRTLPRTRI